MRAVANGAVSGIAEKAYAEGTGARGLMTVLEQLFRDFKFELPSTAIRSIEISPETNFTVVTITSVMAEEDGHFTLDDVFDRICDKMERRHPHVFGDATVGSAEEQSRAWEQHKSAEREHHQSALDGVALALPSLMRAEKLQRRAARVGFDWPDISGPLAKCHEEIAEVEQALQQQDQEEIAAEIGDLLFSVVNLARFAGTDPEEALRGSNLRFTRRFQQVESLVEEQGREMSGMSLQELDALWDEAKKAVSEEIR